MIHLHVRNIKTFFKDIAEKPPLLFPLVVLFHLIMFLYTLWSVHDAPFPAMEWMQPLVTFVFLFFWVAACDLRKWGAFIYILITAADLLLLYVMKYPTYRYEITRLAPEDAVFSFFLMFYYKRFR
jgi:hypothetical protein